MHLIRSIQNLKKHFVKNKFLKTFKKSGFTPSPISSFKLDSLSDSELAELNSILNWNCFTTDSQGRRFGRPHTQKKRGKPQTIPDRRSIILDEVFQIKGCTVLEVGCFEGVHTVSLCSRGALVTAIDSRIENVIKTIVRSNYYGFSPNVFNCDVENLSSDMIPKIKADYVHHVGVLYHLKDPIKHLIELGALAQKGLILDTHFATPESVNGEYESQGIRCSYFRANEFGHKDVFSGMYDHSKWLLLDDIKRLLVKSGFATAEIYETRLERNGSRAIFIAKK